MKKFFLLLAAAVILAGCGGAEPLVLSGTIETTEIDVYTETGGKVVEIVKDEGDAVAVGETVALLDTADAETQRAQAAANVKQAQARLDELLAGTRAEEVAQAEAALRIAEANLAELRSGTRAEQLRQAAAAVAEAEAYLNETKAGAGDEEIAQAELRIREAETAVARARQQLAYNEDNVAMVRTLREAGAAAEQQLTDAENQYDIAVKALETARMEQGIAEESLALLRRGASEQTIAAAEARREQAAAALALLRDGATEQAITAAEAAAEQSRAALAYALNGASPEQITAAEAAVEAAQAGLAQTERLLEKCRVTAPVAGTMQYRGLELGQVAAAGRIAATLQTDDYWIRVYVPQKYNGLIQLGQTYAITVSNLAEPVQGRVVYVAAKAEFTPKNTETTEAKQENTVFAVKLKIDAASGLNPGMTARVTLSD